MDILHDLNYKTWYHIGRQYGEHIPDYVKNANVFTKEAAEKLPDSAFADEIHRYFPIDTKDHVWLSAAYFAKNAEQCKYTKDVAQWVEKRIKSAAQTFGILNDVEKIIDVIRTNRIVKKANNDNNDTWGLILDNGQKKYPMFDQDGVKKAIDYFIRNRSRYPRDVRNKIANAIIKKAQEYNISVPEQIRKSAGVGFPRRDTLAEEILSRAQLIDDPKDSSLLANINKIVLQSPMDELCSGLLERIASILDLVDSNHGLKKMYGVRILIPDDVVYDIDPNEAEEIASNTVNIGGELFDLRALIKLPINFYQQLMGDEFVEEIVDKDGNIDPDKLRSALSELSKPEQYMFLAALDSYCQQDAFED